MKKLILSLALLVLVSGCLCGLTEEKEEGKPSYVCNPPYIMVGSECCLDQNQNNICDQDETVETTNKPVETTIPVVTTNPPTTAAPVPTITTTVQVTTSVQATTSTSIPVSYQCVKDAGYDPDSFILVYSDDCGGTSMVSQADVASLDANVDLNKIHIGMLDPKEIKLLECFIGKYYEGNTNFFMCPRLMCPKTGKSEFIRSTIPPVSVQMRSFANKCK